MGRSFWAISRPKGYSHTFGLVSRLESGGLVMRRMCATFVLVTGVMISVLLASAAHANTFTLTCGEPLPQIGGPSTGEIKLTLIGSDPKFGLAPFFADATIPLTGTAEEKCAAIHTALGVGTLSGNTLTITDTGGDFWKKLVVVSDTTGEFTSISAHLAVGQKASLIEVPTSTPGAVPAAGTTFTGGLFAPSFAITFFESANGTSTATNLVGQMNSQIMPFTGTFGPITILTGPTSFVTGFQTPFFDPPSASIVWDANTGLDLANFGIEVGPTPVPEPASVLLISTAIVPLWCRCRKRN